MRIFPKKINTEEESMKKIRNSVVSLMLTAALAVSLVCTLCVTGSASAAKAPEDIDRVVVDCRSAAAFERTSSVFTHVPTQIEPDILTGGKYSFDADMQAMKIEYNENALLSNKYRVLLQFNQKNSVTEEYKYWVIVYAAKSSSPYELTLWNGGSQGVRVSVTSGTKGTDGKFVVSEPYDISVTNDPQGRSSLTRWINGAHATVSFTTAATDGEFYIKEYAFFKSAEDAKAYYAGVDLNKSPEEYGPNAGITGNLSEEAELAPIIVSFESEDALSANAMRVNFDDRLEGLGGLSEFVKLSDGTGALKLSSHVYTGEDNTGYANYRVVVNFRSAGLLSEEHKYARVTYMTTDTKPHTIILKNNATNQRAVLAQDTSVSEGEFVISAPVNIYRAGLTSRFFDGKHCTLAVDSTLPDSEILIKEIALFTSITQAEAYDGTVDTSKYDSDVIDLSPSKLTDPNVSTSTAAPVIMKFSNERALNTNAKLVTFKDRIEGIQGLQKFVHLKDGTMALQLLPHVYTGEDNTGYPMHRVMPAFSRTNMLTADHKYVRLTYMTTDSEPRTIFLKNNASNARAVLTADTSISGGKFVTTNAVEIESAELLKRFIEGKHCTIAFDGGNEDSKIYLKELAFFTSPQQAYEYYGDAAEASGVQFAELLFGTMGNVAVNRTQAVNGNSTDSHGTLDIVYSADSFIKYTSKISSNVKDSITSNHNYIRVLYSASNPVGVENAAFFIEDDKNKTRVLLDGNVTDTNGSFILTDTAYITPAMAEQFNSGTNSIYFNPLGEDGKYSIKAIYLFATRDEAEAFEIPRSNAVITVDGTDISEFKIVISKDAPSKLVSAVKTMSSAIYRSTGKTVPVVTDETAVGEHEILAGLSSRPLSKIHMDELKAAGDFNFGVYAENGCLIISTAVGVNADELVTALCTNLFHYGKATVPEKIDFPSGIVLSGIHQGEYVPLTDWDEGETVSDPTVVTVDFSSDDGYFNEDNGEKNWKHESGAYKTAATEFASSYLHVYEKNVIYKATLSYSSENGGNMGIMARQNSLCAFVKAGYDFSTGEWYIEDRDGEDFYLTRSASKHSTVAPNTEYKLALTVKGDTASLSVNGETVIESAKLDHLSPGRIGVYAENAAVSVDDVEITLLSGMGTVWQNVYHTKLPDEVYREGGTVIKRNDGSLSYINHSGATFKSLDGGYSWERDAKWTDYYASGMSIQIIRLNNGDLLRIAGINEGGKQYRASKTSSDDGKTWGPYSIICGGYYKDSRAVSANMNDKVFQSATTDRIFYSQQYESTAATGAGEAVEGRYIFCEFFYSDDNGKTWTKSETDSWTIPGNEDQTHFSECKMLECADGTIRVYCSWSYYGHITYADSTDGGKTFGPLQHMYEFQTPASSMQFARDPYAENDSTYYMVWINAEPTLSNSQPRYRLSLAKTENGKDWLYLGDVWRWESSFAVGTAPINHIVDPFIYVTEDAVICGSGFSEHTPLPGESSLSDYHQAQRQHIYTVKKDTLPEGKTVNKFTDAPMGN